ncbi:MAG TPA: hypothetical protein VGC89_11355 [Pyrinomonadaceae bacterium]
MAKETKLKADFFRPNMYAASRKIVPRLWERPIMERILNAINILSPLNYLTINAGDSANATNFAIGIFNIAQLSTNVKSAGSRKNKSRHSG